MSNTWRRIWCVGYVGAISNEPAFYRICAERSDEKVVFVEVDVKEGSSPAVLIIDLQNALLTLDQAWKDDTEDSNQWRRSIPIKELRI